MSSPMRNELMRLVISVLAIDAVAIAVFFLAELRRASSSTLILFGFIWTIATVAVVLVGLRRVREARLEAMRTRPRTR